jgi:hypothetical protein
LGAANDVPSLHYQWDAAQLDSEWARYSPWLSRPEAWPR